MVIHRLEFRRVYLAPMVSFILLSGLAVEWYVLHLPHEDASGYHQAVRRAAAQVPHHLADWVSTDTELPRSAVALLKPNVQLGRQFRNMTTGQVLQVLFIQCADARDLAGHHPPRCYPSSGWTMVSATPRNWPVAERTIGGMEYVFAFERLEGNAELTVYHFVVRPDGGIERDTRGLHQAAVDPRKKSWGGAQVQFVFADSAMREERDSAFSTLLPLYLPVIEVVQSMVRK